MIERSAKYTADRTKDSVQLMAPRTCEELPAKSKTTSLPRTSTATRMGTGSSRITPSSSRWSANRYVPSGIDSMVARAARSL